MKRFLLFMLWTFLTISMTAAQAAADCTDPYEPNNIASQATILEYLGDKSNLCLTAGDEDWFKYEAKTGEIYYIRIMGYSGSTEGAYGLKIVAQGAGTRILETYETDGSTDTKMYLYNSSLQQIAFNDDGGAGYFSRIVFEIGGCSDPLEPNNTSSQATNLGTTTSFVNASLCLTQGDEDWFKFSYDGRWYYILVKGYSNTTAGAYRLTFSRSGATVTIETSLTAGSTDTKLYLYNASDLTNSIAYDDDGGSGYFSFIVHTISTNCADPLEPNNTISQAYDLGLVTSYNNADLCLTPGDEDWLKFTYNSQAYYILIKGYSTSTEGAYGLIISRSDAMLTLETYETNGSTDTKVFLYNSSYHELAFDDDGGSGYFSRISANLGGCNDPLEPNNSAGQATDLGTTTNYNNANLCLTPGDSDWLKFTHNSHTYYIRVEGYSSSVEGAYGLRFNRSGATISIETYATDGSTDTKMYLFNPSLSQTSPVAFDDDGGMGYFSRIVYTIPDDCSDPLEPNNSVGQATDQGTTPSYNNANLCLTPGDEDWIKFTYKTGTYYIRILGYSGTTEGAYGYRFNRLGTDLTIETYETDGSTDTKMYLYNSSLQQLAFDDDGGSGYFSRIVIDLGGCSDPLEPNNTYDQASYLGLNTVSYINAELCLTVGDEDWFKFTYKAETFYLRIMGYSNLTEGAYGFRFNRSGTTWTIETYETDGATDTKMYLYHSSSLTHSVAFDDDGGTGYFSRIVYTLPAYSCIPTLVSPANYATLINGTPISWLFDWSYCSYATAYHLYVTNANSSGSAVDKDDITTSRYTFNYDGFVPTEYRTGWYWRVRSKVAGEWGPWSSTRYFSVGPQRTPADGPEYTPGETSPSGLSAETSRNMAENDISLDASNWHGPDEFSIFPNPTEGKITIRMASSNQDDHLSLEIMDVTGKMMIQKQVQRSGGEFREEIDLSDYPAGLYFINLEGADFHKVGKLIVH